jgi:hypothetical protein
VHVTLTGSECCAAVARTRLIAGPAGSVERCPLRKCGYQPCPGWSPLGDRVDRGGVVWIDRLDQPETCRVHRKDLESVAGVVATGSISTRANESVVEVAEPV